MTALNRASLGASPAFLCLSNDTLHGDRRSFSATLLELTRLQAAASQLRERYVSVTRTCSPPLPSPAPHRKVEMAAMWAAQVRTSWFSSNPNPNPNPEPHPGPHDSHEAMR